MPTVIDTSTASTATGTSTQRKVDRCQNGVLWSTFWNGTATTTASMAFWYSTDNGATWTEDTAGRLGFTNTTANYTPNSSLFIDLDDFAHFVYKDRNDGFLYYRRGTPNAGRTAWTWSALQTVYANVFMSQPSVVAHREGTGWKAHIVHNYNEAGNSYAYYARFGITSAGVFTKDVGSGGTSGPVSLNAVAHNFGTDTQPTIDFHHTGDGKTVQGSAPHLFIGWGGGNADASNGWRFKKATYSGGAWTFGTERAVDPSDIEANGFWFQCMFDGTRVVLVGYAASGLLIYDRDVADTTTTITGRAVLADALATRLAFGSATYDSNANVYVVGRNADETAGTFDLVYRKWQRTSGTLDAETILDTGVGDPYVAFKLGHVSSRLEFIYTDGTASPYSVTHGVIVLNVAPNAPTLASPVGSATIDRTIGQRFSWTFSDPDTGDSQSKYDLDYRLVGAGSFTTVTTTTPNAFHDFAAAFFAAGNYEWRVRTYDALGVVGPYSSVATFTAATPPTAPTITAPTSGGTIGSETFLVQWSTPDQDAYEVRRVADAAGVADTATVYSTTGTVVSAGRSASISFPVNGRFEHVQVRTRFATLWSTWASVRVNVSYTVPATPTVALTANVPTGAITVQATHPTPVANLLTVNQASLETDTTGWTNRQNATLTRSTAQARHGVASLSVATTTAGAGDPNAETISVRPNVTVGASYTALASVRAAATARGFTVAIVFADAGGSLIVDASLVSVTGTDTTTGWTQVSATSTAPSNAATALMIISVQGAGATAGEVHYIDQASIHAGSSTTWALPGAGGPAVTSQDVHRRVVGDTGDGIRVAAARTPTAAFVDYAISSGVSYSFRVRAYGANGTSVYSAWVT